MNQELKAKWVAALRGGEYKQTTGTLKDEGCYCCLGVFCEINDFPMFYSPADKAGIDVDKFVHLNDKERLSFAEIADYIEANL